MKEVKREGGSQVLSLNHKWNRIHGKIEDRSLRPQTWKFAFRSFEQCENCWFWTFKCMEIRRYVKNSLWKPLLRCTWDDSWKEISWDVSRHLVSWNHPLCYDLWISSFWGPKHVCSLQENSERLIRNSKLPQHRLQGVFSLGFEYWSIRKSNNLLD